MKRRSFLLGAAGVIAVGIVGVFRFMVVKDSKQLAQTTYTITPQDVTNTYALIRVTWPVVFNNEYCIDSSFSTPAISTCIDGGLVNVTSKDYQHVIRLGNLKAGTVLQVWGVGFPMQTPSEPLNFNVTSN